jgi:hypothetical protein
MVLRTSTILLHFQCCTFQEMTIVLRCHNAHLARLQADQSQAIGRSTWLPTIPGPAGIDTAMVACFPTPVDDQGEPMLLNLTAAATSNCNPFTTFVHAPPA